MHEHVLERLALKADLQRAVIADEFDVHYQPIVTLQTGEHRRCRGARSLEAPGARSRAPGDFIGLAEETGLILPLGRHVLDQACRAGRELATARPPASSASA